MSPDRLYWWRPGRQAPPVGLEAHRTADLEVGATNLRSGSWQQKDCAEIAAGAESAAQRGRGRGLLQRQMLKRSVGVGEGLLEGRGDGACAAA